jgi:hypothetical protein
VGAGPESGREPDLPGGAESDSNPPIVALGIPLPEEP